MVSWTLLELQRLLAYHSPMLPPERTPRQRIMELLTGTRLTTHQLAQMLAIPERQVEDHLMHAVKSIARDKTRRFILEPSRCQDCDFVFRDRRRLTRPSRCPHCRSEGITAPRYGIDSVGSPAGRVDSNVSGR
ncbi:MAG: transcriptional regulator [Nitrospirae bacterium]|nr:transcriptional regulator [Nitrospirota bacterium]